MREKVVLRAVIEFITRTQLAAYVETHSSNTNSNRSPANNRHSRPFFLGRRDCRQSFAGTLSPEVVTIHVHHAEIIAQLGENHVVTAVDTKGLFHLLNLMQQGDLSYRGKEAGFNRISRQFTQVLGGKAKGILGQTIFVMEVAFEHRRVIGIESNHKAGIEITAYRMLLQGGTTTGA